MKINSATIRLFLAVQVLRLAYACQQSGKALHGFASRLHAAAQACHKAGDAIDACRFYPSSARFWDACTVILGVWLISRGTVFGLFFGIFFVAATFLKNYDRIRPLLPAWWTGEDKAGASK